MGCVERGVCTCREGHVERGVCTCRERRVESGGVAYVVGRSGL